MDNAKDVREKMEQAITDWLDSYRVATCQETVLIPCRLCEDIILDAITPVVLAIVAEAERVAIIKRDEEYLEALTNPEDGGNRITAIISGAVAERERKARLDEAALGDCRCWKIRSGKLQKCDRCLRLSELSKPSEEGKT